MADIKVQFVFGQEAHTDQRGTPVGAAEGDHHTTLKEWRIEDPVEIEAVLQSADVANKVAVAAGYELFGTLEDAGILDELLVAASAFAHEDVTDAKFAAVLLRVYDND